MANGKVVVDVELDGSQVDSGVADIERSLGNIGSGLKNLGGDLTKKVTLPILAAGAGIVTLGSSFDTSMSKVEAISGATGQELAQLEATAREMGATTRYSASESADALGYMALAGWDTNQMISALPGVLNLATAGELELAQASDILTDVMSMFGIEADDASRATDVFARAQADSNTSVEQLSEALNRAGPAASAAGNGIEDTAAVLGIMANQGLKGSAAGTALNAMYRDLQAAAEDGSVAIGDHSVAVYDSEGNMRDMSDIMRDVETATADMTGEQRNAAMAQIFQQQSLRGANMLLNEGTDSLFDFKDGLENSSGAAEEMAAIMDDNAAGSLKNLWSAIEEVALSFWKIIEGPFRAVVDSITEIVRWFGDLDGSIQVTIVVLAALAAAIGPILLVIGTLISLIPVVVKGFSMLMTGVKLVGAAFSLATIKITLIIAAIGLVVAAVMHLWNTNETFRNAVITVWTAIQTAISAAVEAVVSFVMSIWGQLVAWWQENNQMILEAAQNVWNVIQTVIQVAMTVIMAIMHAVWPVIQALIMTVWTAIQNVIQGAVNVILGIIEFFAALFTGNWSALWESVKTIVSGAVQLIWGLVNLWFVGRILKLGQVLFTSLRGIVSAGWNVIRNVFSTVLNVIRNIVSTVWNAIRTVITTVMNAIRSVITSIWNAIRGTITSVLNGIRSVVTSVWNAIRSAISSVMNAIRSIITSVWNAIRSVVTSVLNTIRSIVTSVFNAIRSVINSVMNTIRSIVTSVWNSIRSVITSVSNSIRSVVTSVFNAIRSVISSVMSSISSIISSIWNSIRSTISNILNSIRSTVSNIFNSLSGIVSSAFSAVRSAVQNGMTSAYNAVTNFLGRFRTAGRNIVTSIADGIRGAIGKVTSAISSVTQKIRDFLPFSPAKEGALRDIMDTNITGSIADTIRKDNAPIKQMRKLTDSIADEAQMDVSNRLRGASYNFGGLMPQVSASQVVEHNRVEDNAKLLRAIEELELQVQVNNNVDERGITSMVNHRNAKDKIIRKMSRR